MRSSIALLIASASAAVLIATPARAYDFRQLVKYSHQEYPTSSDFCDAWDTACKEYVPKDQSLKYGYSVCEPGDYHGKHAKTEAKVACVFLHNGDEHEPQSINHHIAAKVHATYLSDNDA
ncbi:uncharacterized protein FA14DRAFT_181266 [Meira miltonrushii]|uniref:Uncharacterized protein n=1 Tax=Meira miltonrushii TaxID=1280837 RepID=A0A316V550_9BASI|nr:uncharacterized protein FA14DRAFT_181266 [Meira miltonrushii]PWN32582.1 hypothetical protein FA14DRAFT_181266 [Meira miltonrushii]